MSSVDQLWLTHIGSRACAALTRRVRYGRSILLTAVVSVACAGVCGVVHPTTGAGLSVLIGVVGVAALGVLAVRSAAVAGWAAAAYLGLPRDSWRDLPVSSVDAFDRWISRRTTPGWPKHR